MNTIEGLTIRWQPWTVQAVLGHVIQSTMVGLVILALMFVARRASARTRWIIAWIGLIKFVLPLIWFNPTFSHLKPPSIDRWSLLPPGLAHHESATGPGGIAPTQGSAHPAPAAPADVLLIDGIAAVWAAGAVLLIGRWCLRGYHLRRGLLATAEPVSIALKRRVDRAAERVGLAKLPRCVAIDGTSGPGIVGVFSPIVVLPRVMERSLSGEEIDAILIHEFTHVRRHDSLFTAAQAVVVRLFWFNPVAWFLNQSLHVETEKSCDEAVLDITANAKVYAGGILKVVRHSLGLRKPGFAGVTGVPIAARVKNILDRSAAPHRRRPMGAAIAAAVAVFAFSGFSGAIRADSAAGMPTGKVLVVRNPSPFNRIPNFETELGDLGYVSATIESDAMATADLSQYSLIVLPAAQWQTGFHADYAKTEERFDRFVQNGGTLLLEVNGAEAEGLLRQSFRAIPDPSDSSVSRLP